MGWHTEQRCWTSVAPSNAEVDEGVVFDEPDEHALVKAIKTSSVKRMAADLILIISPKYLI
jgi:hypothetical protein